jgi:hypothetical protein
MEGEIAGEHGFARPAYLEAAVPRIVGVAAQAQRWAALQLERGWISGGIS